MKPLPLLLACLTLAFTGFPYCLALEADDKNTVIMIGIDGLRTDAIDRIDAPTLRALAKNGVRAKGMKPAMPSKTFVNFYSLATGLHPKHHGMTSNYPYDRIKKRTFSRKTDTRDPAWWDGEPIWITAEKQGVKAATYFWVGSEVAIDGIHPSYWKPFDQQKDYSERVTEVLGWLAKPKEERPQLITLYFSAVDTAVHEYGVGSSEEGEAVKKVDGHVRELLEGLKSQGTLANTNIIIVADHGMANLSQDRMINLDDYANIEDYNVPDWNKDYGPSYAPFLYLYGSESEMTDAYAKLKGKHPHMKVWRKGEFPENYHFDHPLRGPDIMVLADTGWTLFSSEDKSSPDISQIHLKATHGYDNHDPLMHATFIASGPAFQKGKTIDIFDNIEVYNILACTLGITPAKNDGKIEHIQNMLVEQCSIP